ncbi:MAG: hypothetical protein M3Y81_17605 [Chloroflexota bacterium]|nr:hypothetical protein [Chloroflexota bacterium]
MAVEKGNKRRIRRDTGPRLTERDLLALCLTGEQYALRFDQVQRWLGAHAKAETLVPGVLSDSATRHTVDRWELAGLVEWKKILADEPAYLWLTTAGLHAAGLPFRRFVPAPASLRHIYCCTQVRLALERSGYTWQSERWLRSDLDQKIKRVKLPDAHLSAQGGVPIAVEVELTQKNVLKLAEILKDRSLVYASTWYFAPAPVCRAVQAACSQLDEMYQKRIHVYDIQEVL